MWYRVLDNLITGSRSGAAGHTTQAHSSPAAITALITTFTKNLLLNLKLLSSTSLQLIFYIAMSHETSPWYFLAVHNAVTQTGNHSTHTRRGFNQERT